MAVVGSNTRRVAVPAVAAAVAASLAGAASSSSRLGSTNGGGYRDVTKLIPEATLRVRAKPGFSKAVLLEADGSTTGNRQTTSATGITRWRFVYNDQGTPNFKYRSAFLYYARGRFGRIVANRSPFVEDLNIPRVPKMTLVTAVAKLRAAGYRSGFSNVTLRHPIAGRPGPEPLYIGSGRAR